MCDIQEIRVSVLDSEQGFAVGESLALPSGNAVTILNSNLSTTLESDGRGHFIFSSTGQRFQGTTTNDGETKVFRPTQRVVLDFEVRKSVNTTVFDKFGSVCTQNTYSIKVKGVLECVRATLRP